MISIESLYIHFPFCKKLCNYCDFHRNLLNNRDDNLKQFHLYLDKSIEIHKKLLRDNNLTIGPIKTLYIGGGTPSLWGEEGITYLSQLNFKFSKDYEFTLELNPGTLNAKQIQQWLDIGVNRFSIGIQSLDQLFFENLNRLHSIEQAKTTLDFFKSSGLNYSADLLLGLPLQNKKREIKKEIDTLLSFSPSHISLYILTPKDNYIYKNTLPEDHILQEEYLEASCYLKENGFIHYEVSNFSLPKKESKHNLMYWNSESVAAFGPSSTGMINITPNKKSIRYKWNTHGPTFETEHLSEKELKMERLYLSLRTNLGINLETLYQDFNADIKKLSLLIAKWSEQNLLNDNKERLILNSRGFIILDSLIDQLFNVLKF